MIVYRIRRKSDNKFWCGWRWVQNVEYWNDKGILYRDIDTIKHHLDWLCTDESIPNNRRTVGYKHNKPEKIIHQRMKRYEIVINDITINGEKVISASEFRKYDMREESS